MLVPLYVVAAILNIIAKNNNYNIKTSKNPNFDVRVRRDATNESDRVLLRKIIKYTKSNGDYGKYEDDGEIFNQDTKPKILRISEISSQLEYIRPSEHTEENTSFVKQIDYQRNSTKETTSAVQNVKREADLVLQARPELEKELISSAKRYIKKRNASIGSGIGSFFSNIYNKMYDLTHSKTKIQIDPYKNSYDNKLGAYTDYNTYNNITHTANNQTFYDHNVNNFYTNNYPNRYPYSNYSYNHKVPNNNFTNYNNQYDLYPNYNLNNTFNPYNNLNGYNVPHRNNFTNYNNLYTNIDVNNYTNYANSYYNRNNDSINNELAADNGNSNAPSTTDIVIQEGFIFGGVGCPKNHRRVAFMCTPGLIFSSSTIIIKITKKPFYKKSP